MATASSRAIAPVASGRDRADTAASAPGFRSRALEVLRREGGRDARDDPVVIARSDVGTGAVLAGTSLRVFGPGNRWRLRVFAALYRQSTELALFALIVAHFVVLLLLAGEARDDAREDAPSSADAGAAALFAPSRSWPARLDVAILVAYTIEAFLRVFALGFASGPHAYLRDNYNRLDFVVVLASWTVVTVRARNWARWPLASGLGQFRLFRAFLALREYPVSGALVAIVEALSRSVDVLIDLSGVTALCAAFYGLMGVALFAGSLRRRCVLTDSAETAGSFFYALGGPPDLACGDAGNDPNGRGFVCPGVRSARDDGDGDFVPTGVRIAGGGTRLFASGGAAPDEYVGGELVASPLASGGASNASALNHSALVPLGADLFCSELAGNPKFGHLSFDDFPSALLTMFACITLEGWDEAMYATMNAEYRWAAAYFITLVVIGAYVIVSLFVAAISGVFLRLRKDHQVLLLRTREKKRRDAVARAARRMEERGTRPADEEGDDDGDDDRKKGASVSPNARAFALVVREAVDAADEARGGHRALPTSPTPPKAPKRAWEEAPEETAETKGGVERGHASGARGMVRERAASPPSRASLPFGARLARLTGHPATDRWTKLVIAANVGVMCAYRRGMDPALLSRAEAAERFFLAAFVLETAARSVAAACAGPGSRTAARLLAWDVAALAVAAGCIAGGASSLAPPLRMVRFFFSAETTTTTTTTLAGGDDDERIDECDRASSTSKPRHRQHGPDFRRQKTGDRGRIHRRASGDVLRRVFASSGALASLAGFYVALSAAFALLGMQLYGGRWEDVPPDEPSMPRENFDTFPDAMLTMFAVSTGEGWTNLLYNAMRLEPRATPPFLIVFFVLVNYVLLNLVIATVLEKLELRDDEKQARQRAEILRRTAQRELSDGAYIDALETARCWFALAARGERWSRRRAAQLSPRLEIRQKRREWLERRIETERDAACATTHATTGCDRGDRIPGRSPPATSPRGEASRRWAPPPPSSARRARSLSLASLALAPPGTRRAPKSSAGCANAPPAYLALGDDADAGGDASFPPPPECVLPSYVSARALFLFDEDNRFRAFCSKTLASPWYQLVACAFIAASLAAVLGTDPIDQMNAWQGWIDIANVAVAVFFTVDFALKCVSLGFAFTPAPYLSSPWRVLDLTMLAVDVSLLWPRSRWWRWAFNVLIAARPVRVLNRSEPMRRLVETLAATLPSVASVMRLGAVIFLGFAVVGTRLFGGRFERCNDPGVRDREACVGQFAVPSPIAPGFPSRGDGFVAMRREWGAPRFSFDWIGASLLTLFEVASLDGWLDVLHSAMDAAPRHDDPRIDAESRHRQWWLACAYFVSFVALGSFFFARSLVGVFIDQFGNVSGAKLITERQKLWRDLRSIARTLKPVPVASPPPGRDAVAAFRRFCHALVSRPSFDRAAFALVCLDAATLATRRAGDGDERRVRDVQDAADACFVVLFLLEAAAKALAAHPHARYWRSRWNRFELALALGAAATAVARRGGVREQIGRPFRFFRVFRVVRFAPSLQTLCDQITAAVPSILGIVGLMLAWAFAYAGIGTQVFPNVKYGRFLNKDANFETFPNSFLVLFQCLTGEGWRGFMRDAAIAEPDCTRAADGSEGDCGFPNGAVLYFVSYVVAMGYVFTNLFVAAVLDHVAFGAAAGRDALVAPRDLHAFKERWAAHDPNATGFIGAHRVGALLDDLGAPLGVAPGEARARAGAGEGGGDGRADSSATAGRMSAATRDERRRVRGATRFAAWRRSVTREAKVIRVEGRGVPFDGLLETLVAARLGPSALTADVRASREREIGETNRWGAAVTIQAWWRGERARRANAVTAFASTDRG